MDFYNKQTKERAAHVWLARKLGLHLPATGPDTNFVARALAAGFGQIVYSEPDFDPRTHAKEPKTLKENSNGSFTQGYKVVALPPEVVAANLVAAKGEKLTEANALCDAELRALVAKYPDMEISTFAKQESEARALAQDLTAEAPFLSALAANRGLALQELAIRVLAHAEAFGQASGVVIGQRQAIEDRIEAATDFAQLDAVEIAYTLPWKA